MQVLVITPTYNERDNLPDLVRAVLAREGYRMMIVDDNSPDGTGDVADALAREVHAGARVTPEAVDARRIAKDFGEVRRHLRHDFRMHRCRGVVIEVYATRHVALPFYGC